MASRYQDQQYNAQHSHGNQGTRFQQQQHPNQQPLNNFDDQEMYGNQNALSQQQPQYGNQQQFHHDGHRSSGQQNQAYVEMRPQQQPQFGLIEQQPQASSRGAHSQQYGNQGRQQAQYSNQGPQHAMHSNQGLQQPMYGNYEPNGQQPQYGNFGPNEQQPQYGNQGANEQQPPQYGNQGLNGQPQPQYGNQLSSGPNFSQNQMTMPQKPHSGSQQNPPPVPRPRKKSLPRTISSTNLESTSRCRSIVQKDWVVQAPQGGTNFFSTVPAFTLALPSLDNYPADFQQFVFDRLIDKYTQSNLQNDKCLNWCKSATQLVPLFTTGDGNCLLHAASLAMWGFQDRDFTLRRAVYTALQNHSSTQLRRRWKYSREKENHQMGIQLEDDQWEREWHAAVSQASPETTEGMPLESLDDFHIFVLANVLRRPIIMYAAPKLRSQATGGTLQHINFHGIYLPLLWEPNSCKKDPLPLGYFGGHFVALVAIEYRIELSKGKFTLPLTDFHGQVLPVRFALRMEEPVTLIMDYLSTSRITCTGEPYITTKSILGAQLSIVDRPAYLQPLLSGFIEACRQAHFGNSPHQQRSQPLPVDSWESQPRDHQAVAPTSSSTTGSQGREKCINNCGAYGDPDKGGMCSQCYRKYREQHPAQSEESMFFSKPSVPQSEATIQPKCINNCGNRGNPDNGGFCSQCHQRYISKEQEVSRQKCINACGAYAEPGSGVGLCSACLQKATQAASANEGGNVQRNELNAPPPQASNGGGHSLNSGSIKCPKCANPGHPSYLGMCEACYQGRSLGNEVTTGKDHIYETIPGPPNKEKPLIAQDPDIRKNCPTPNCEFFGTAQTLFYCSKCFERDMEKILKEADNPQPQNYFPDQTIGQPRAPPPRSSGFEQRVDVFQQQQSDPLPKRNPNNLCSQCQKFYASPEYGGDVCSTCFLEKTKAQTQESFVQKPMYNPCQTRDCNNQAEAGSFCNQCLSNQSFRPTTAPVYQPQYSKCETIDCNGMRTKNGFCDNCNFSFNRPSFASTQQHPSSARPQNGQPVPKPRRQLPNSGGISTAPIANLSTQMEGMRVSDEERSRCFMCTGTDNGSYVLCRQHAEEVRKSAMITVQHSLNPESQGQPRGQHSQTEFLQQPDGRGQGAPNQGGARQPQYGNPPFPSQQQATGFPPHQQLPRNQYGNTPQGQGQRRSPPPHSGAAFQPQDRTQFGVDMSQGHFQQQHASPQRPPKTNPPPHGSHSYGNPQSQAASSSGMQFGVNIPPHQANASAGAATGSAVRGGGMKQLCATAGCSYKGYRELNDLCPDCYEDTTHLKAPDQYPLV